MPKNFVRKVYFGIPYYIVDDIYYRYHNGYYYVCRPPFGVHFVFDATAAVVHTLCHFAYYTDRLYTYSVINDNVRTIYEQNEVIAANNALIASQAEVIESQAAAIEAQAEALESQANALAAMASSSDLNAERAASAARLADRLGLAQSYASVTQEYYYDDGVFYVQDSSGDYVTIVPPAGALVEELPDDYRTVYLDDHEYYAVDNTIYRTTIVDETLYFEVLGQQVEDPEDEEN